MPAPTMRDVDRDNGAAMDTETFRQRGKEMVDYMCDYMNTIGSRPVMSSVTPGYLRDLVPDQPPLESEPWPEIMRDVENVIMPGITHWQHPRFHAYFPSGNSWPSILGDMLSDVIGCIGFSWVASPACTELETIVLDWLGKAIGLPEEFLSTSGKGGGVLQGSASDCVLVCMLAARTRALKRLHEQNGGEGPETQYIPCLVAYCSREAHSCVEKAGLISLVKIRVIEPGKDSSLRGHKLREAIEEDIQNNLVPIFVSATLGTTGSCAFDNLSEIGAVARQHDCWLHVDAAYAGCAFICPEYRDLLAGIELADSFNTNPNKFLLTNFDCSCLWVKDGNKLSSALNVDPLYLKHEHQGKVIDYRHWGIPLSRRFRALKLWFVIRSYGISGLQRYIRNHATLAKRFETLVRSDSRFEVVNKVRMGLVCFRLKEEDNDSKLTVELLTSINHSGRLHMIPARVQGKIIIRFCVIAENAIEADIDLAWDVISKLTSEMASPGSPHRTLPSTLEGRRLARQLSFTFPVPQAVLSSSSRPSLYDGATPIIVPDDENCFEEVFDAYLAKQDAFKG